MRRYFAAALISCIVPTVAHVQTLTPLVHPALHGAQLALLLTDGSVMTHEFNDSGWRRLVPDNTGSYMNGTWHKAASLPAGYAPLAGASAVLADGRVLLAGGEYNERQFTLTNLSAIYDPKADTWTMVTPPKNWDFIGDLPSVVLPNGDFLIGDKLNRRMAELDPATLTWKEVGSFGKDDFNAEEGWTLLPEGVVLTADVKDAPKSEIYYPLVQEWLGAGSTIVNLRELFAHFCVHYGNGKCYYPPGEIGPAILRPDGTVFATGAAQTIASVSHTAIYATTGSERGWAAGPDIPNGDSAADTWAALLPNGNVLLEGDSGVLYEFDGRSIIIEPFSGRRLGMLLLPTGEVLVDGAAVYASTGTYRSNWAPVITQYPQSVTRGGTFAIYGRQFNGLSQANAYGDEFQIATNYPLVRITNQRTGHVIYARTHDHSTMGVATGKAIVWTNFDVPGNAETGTSSLVVVANGIPSVPVPVTVN